VGSNPGRQKSKEVRARSSVRNSGIRQIYGIGVPGRRWTGGANGRSGSPIVPLDSSRVITGSSSCSTLPQTSTADGVRTGHSSAILLPPFAPRTETPSQSRPCIYRFGRRPPRRGVGGGSPGAGIAKNSMIPVSRAAASCSRTPIVGFSRPRSSRLT